MTLHMYRRFENRGMRLWTSKAGVVAKVHAHCRGVCLSRGARLRTGMPCKPSCPERLFIHKDQITRLWMLQFIRILHWCTGKFHLRQQGLFGTPLPRSPTANLPILGCMHLKSLSFCNLGIFWFLFHPTLCCCYICFSFCLFFSSFF